MRPTTEQQEIINFNGDGLLQVNAYAGTGKTATLIEFAKARDNKKILYLAFNKSMVDEAKQKFLSLHNVTPLTIHSLAFAQVGYRFKHRLGDLRPADIFPLTHRIGGKNAYLSASTVCNCLNGFMGSAALSMKDYCDQHCDQYVPFIKTNEMDLARFVSVMVSLWQLILTSESLPFPHNAYLKLFQMGNPRLDYDYILVDEAQDVTDCMLDLVLRQRARIVLIGDTYQQIYSWNGAIDSLKKTEGLGTTKYLTKSFRCPQDIAFEANQYLTLMGAPKPFQGNDNAGKGDSAFLARTNAKLFEFAADNYKVANIHYLGGFDSYNFKLLLDIANLKAKDTDRVYDPFIRSFSSFDEFQEYAEACDPQTKARIKIVQRFNKGVIPIYLELKQTQQPDRHAADIVLSTAHKAKGQEFGHVQLGEDFVSLTKLISTTKPTEAFPIEVRQEEMNLLYVAITRSKATVDGLATYCLDDNTLNTLRKLSSKKLLVFTD